MEQRICPHCHKPAYSADTISKFWICPHCGGEIPTAKKMTRYERIKSMSIEEMAEEVIVLNFTDAYCKNDCSPIENDGECEPANEFECCIRWLNEEVEKDVL